MSFYGFEADQIYGWLTTRKAQLTEKFGDAVYDVVGGSPWKHEVNVRIQDAADNQARAERLAYMRGEPVPSDTEILSELLAWIRSGDCKGGGAETLPRLTTAD